MLNISFKSFRARYLLVVILVTLSTFIFFTVIENYITTSTQSSLQNIKERLEVSKLNHSLHTEIQSSSRLIELYLLNPSLEFRIDYLQRMNHSKVIIESLLKNSWVKSQNLTNKITHLKDTQLELKNISLDLMHIRLDAEKMYPAMRLANGSMRSDNVTVISLLNSAVSEANEDLQFNKHIYSSILTLRDKWRSTINAYRLFLINRLSSLSESNLSSQSSDVVHFHKTFNTALETLTKEVNLDTIGIEVATAIEDLPVYAQSWIIGFNKVNKINLTNAWRGDVPIILDEIYPLFDRVFSIIDDLDQSISDSSTLDLKRQHHTSNDVSVLLWSIEAVLILLVTVGYFLLDSALLKPLHNLSTSLRESSNEKFDIAYPNSKLTEIQDFVASYKHMQTQINMRQEKLEHIAMHDDLTNLPNRSLLIDRMTIAIANAQRSNSNFAVIILDLDRFKEVNDTLGHFVGDEVLKQVADRLNLLLRESDTVARLGGDEFALVLIDIDDEYINNIALKICSELEVVYPVNEHNLYLGVSIGISIYPQHGLSSDVLLKHADVAMYMAKQSDINYIIYKPKNDENNIKQLSLLSDLRQAIDLDQLRLHYQPIYSTRNSNIVGFEALIRWQHPINGLVAPNDFIQLAEQTGLIKKITLWVIREALKTFSSWPIDHDNSYISVNVTAWDLQDTNFIEFVKNTLIETRVNPKCLMLELSERSMMTDNARIQVALEKIRNLGLTISIDDFGTGFSSLAILKHLPVSILKIDKSFVLKMASNKSDSMIVHSIIELAHNLELKVIAEGVEDIISRELLQKYHCDYCQGFLYSKPLKDIHVLDLLSIINSTSQNKTS